MESFVGSPNALVALTFCVRNVRPVALAITFVMLVWVAMNREFRVVVMMMVMMVPILLQQVAFRDVAKGLAKTARFRWTGKSTFTTVTMT